MRVELRGVSKGKDGAALPPVDVRYASGEVALATAETDQRPTVLGLIASGRMVPDAGSVTIDGADDGTALRRRVALVDAPPVCDPEPDVTATAVTVEELMFAGRPSTVPAAKRWLTAHGFGHLARTTIGDLVPRDRIALLMELTAMRPEVEGLVLVAPDRHRGEPAEWWEIAQRFAGDGYAVLVVAGAAAARVLGVAAGEQDAAEEPPVVARGLQDPDETDRPQRPDEPDAPEAVEPGAESRDDTDLAEDATESEHSEGPTEPARTTRFDSPSVRSTTDIPDTPDTPDTTDEEDAR